MHGMNASHHEPAAQLQEPVALAGKSSPSSAIEFPLHSIDTKSALMQKQPRMAQINRSDAAAAIDGRNRLDRSSFVAGFVLLSRLLM